MNRIRKTSSYLIGLFNLLIITLPVAYSLFWLCIGTSWIPHFIVQGLFPLQTPQGVILLSKVAWTPLTKIIGFGSDLIGQLPFFIGLLVLRSIFKNYKHGAIFTIDNASSFSKLGWLFLAQAFITTPLSRSLLMIAATFSNHPGHRYLSIEFGTYSIESLFCGIIMIIISWVMLEASKLQEEQTFTI